MLKQLNIKGTVRINDFYSFLYYWSAGRHNCRHNKEAANTADIAKTLLLYQLTITVCLSSLQGFIGHVFMSEQIAAQIGWVPNGFQKELGFVSLGIGIASFMCAWYRGRFWLAVIIIFSAFYLGAAVVHINEMLLVRNFNPLNVFPAISDILIPLTLIICWLLMAKQEEPLTKKR